jgi:hypothetical protein
MVEQESHEFPAEHRETSEGHSTSLESGPDEPAGRWESYSLSILSIFFENT